MTLRARLREFAERSIEGHKPGDRVMLVWDMIGKTQADSIVLIERYQAMRESHVEAGYILPAEFVAADANARTVTFRVPLPSGAVGTVQGLSYPKRVRLAVPMSQPNETAAIDGVEVVER